MYALYILYCTGVLPCASAHREEGWNWSKVATMVSGYYPTVLSQIAITKYDHKYYHNFDRTLCKSGHNPMSPLQEWTLSPFKAEALALSESGHYPVLRAWALSESGTYRILRAWALSKSGNY